MFIPRGSTMAEAAAASRARTALIIAVLLTVALYVIPYGRYLAWPLIWFSTFAHEMGHGLAAALLGNEFVQFQMWPNGSGVAHHAGKVGRLGSAFISTGGLAGPAVLAAVFFGLGRRAKLAKIGLFMFAAGCAIAFVWVVRNPFGWVFVGGLVVVCGVIAHKGSAVMAQVSLVFLAIQLSLSVFSRGDYLFTDVAETAGGTMPSDVARMAEALILPYWFWGGVVGLLSVLVLIIGLWSFLRAATADMAD